MFSCKKVGWRGPPQIRAAPTYRNGLANSKSRNYLNYVYQLGDLYNDFAAVRFRKAVLDRNLIDG